MTTAIYIIDTFAFAIECPTSYDPRQVTAEDALHDSEVRIIDADEVGEIAEVEGLEIVDLR